MLLLENIFLALNGIKSNKSRSILTMLGIIIGIASVISIMTIGNSMTAAMQSEMAGNGADVITVMIQDKDSDFGMFDGFGEESSRRPMKKKDYLTPERIEKLREHFGDRIKGIGLSESVGDGTAKSGNLYAYVTVTGNNESKMATDVDELIEGRGFYDTDYVACRKVAIVSDYFVNNMYAGDAKAAIGKPVTVAINNRNYTYTIVGVYKYSEDFGGYAQTSERNTRTNLYLPLDTAKAQTHNDDGYYRTIAVVASDVSDAAALSDEVKTFLNDYFYRSNNDYQIDCFSMQSLLDSLSESLGIITLAISLIAGIALLVGGIGVMNIMMVSITERTKEIGTRKALGATNASIRTQFIVESIVLCGVGGIIGIILGLIVGSIASNLMKYPASPSISSIFISFGFSTFVGIFFGYYPANKAATMNPIDALRYE